MGLIPLTVHGRGEMSRDENGDMVYETVSREIMVKAVQPKTSNDTSDTNRDGVVSGLTVIAPLGVQVEPFEQVEYLGGLWEVDGVPAVYDSNSQPLTRLGFSFTGMKFPGLGVGCVVINLRKVDG